MKIIILASDKALVTEHRGEVLQWDYSVWGSLVNEPTDKIFGLLNDYLATLPEDVLDKLWECYIRAHDTLLAIGQASSLAVDLTEIINDMARLFDFDHLLDYATRVAGVEAHPGNPVTNTTRNSDEMTVLRDEALEITVFANLVKLVAPIWGTYTKIIKDTVGNVHKERIAGRIFLQSDFTKMRPFIRLEVYLHEMAMIHSKKINTALSHGLPSSDLDSFLMGLTLIRRLCIIPLQHKDKNLTVVSFIYNFLLGQLNGLSSVTYRNKFPKDSGGNQEADSYSDQWRITQDIPDNVPVGTRYYLQEPRRLCEELGFTPVMMNNVLSVLKALQKSENFVINDFHLPLTALVTRKQIVPPIIRLLDRESRLILIAIAAIKARSMGHEDIYSIMLAVKKPVDLHNMYMLTQNGLKFPRLSQELDSRLDACYPHKQPQHINNKTNPGKELIDLIIREVSGSDWLDLDDISELRSSIALFIINRNH